MSELIFLRAFGDLCVCFAIIAGFPKLFVRDVLLLIPALLCAAGRSSDLAVSTSFKRGVSIVLFGFQKAI